MRLRVPRSLIDARLLDLPPADGEGLVTVQLELEAGVVRRIQAAPHTPAAITPLAITPPVDAHAHLDKTFSHSGFPNPGGSMDGALAANRRESEARTAEQVQQRSERALHQAWSNGLRAIRSHIDSGAGAASEASWEVLSAQRQAWSQRVALQLVALVPLQHWLTPEGDALARRVAGQGGWLGGVLGPPFGHGPHDGEAMHSLLLLAERHGCGVDLHVDEGERAAGVGMALVARTALALRPDVPITCSHASSMGLLGSGACERLAAHCAAAKLTVVALPRTNLWLLGRRPGQTPWLRPQAPIRTLQRAGVEVAVAGDNVQDAWYPGGDYDPIELLRFCFTASHLDPRQRQGLAPFTTAAARIMALPWDGVLRPGCPADLLVLGAGSWSELLARPPARRVMRSGRWLPALPESNLAAALP